MRNSRTNGQFTASLDSRPDTFQVLRSSFLGPPRVFTGAEGDTVDLRNVIARPTALINTGDGPDRIVGLDSQFDTLQVVDGPGVDSVNIIRTRIRRPAR